MNWAAVWGQIRSLFISISKQPKQIISKFPRHLVNINPNRQIHRVIQISINPLPFFLECHVIEPPDVILTNRTGHCVVLNRWEPERLLSEEVFEGRYERSLGFGGRVPVGVGEAGVGVGVGGEREKDEEERKDEEGESKEENWGSGIGSS